MKFIKGLVTFVLTLVIVMILTFLISKELRLQWLEYHYNLHG